MSNGSSTKAVLIEKERRIDFYKLVAKSKRPASPIEKTLVMNCFDEINYRYADFVGFFALALGSIRINRGRGFFVRYRLPVYIGLVGYDCGLRASAAAPATTFWNTVCMMDSEMGNQARAIHSPNPFYEITSKNGEYRYKNYGAYLVNSALYIAQSLFLTKIILSVTEGSCWKRSRDSGSDVTALVLSNRFMRMNVFTFIHRKRKNQYHLYCELHPRFHMSTDWYNTFKCREFVLENTNTVAAYLWYWAHFKVFGGVMGIS
ncbi:hypothetical protein AGDE_00772 [Angomonas deanei]|uniref:Uncharacterized protein n=1 Tax=Angomonas deanei TaxID=59799 RepID=S9X409_9TRYP|nr:hypothetical protein AGDE_09223 [Angomonas deanei]EPY43150.1 hypothetical protein AGDE_00772 [Angomonas deanei]CAD2222006.1 hypothetical protein, conserved [Angomonas deanei]|eukprot:EPY31100.1 hypothetical protein AGDE_09223 [Angomonas deanei]